MDDYELAQKANNENNHVSKSELQLLGIKYKVATLIYDNIISCNNSKNRNNISNVFFTDFLIKLKKIYYYDDQTIKFIDYIFMNDITNLTNHMLTFNNIVIYNQIISFFT